MHLVFLDINTDFFNALSWSLIHSLWQGMLFSVFAGMVILFTKKTSSLVRYALLCSLFFLFIGIVIFTFIQELISGSRNSGDSLLSMTDGSSAYSFFHHPSIYNLVEKSTHFLNANSSLIVSIWLIILSVRLFRMILGIIYNYRIRNYQIYQPDTSWTRKVQSFSEILGIQKRVLLFESALVKIPVVVGHFKPVILIPLGILTNLAPGEVEAVLLHELGHIRRNDYVVNLIQNITELVFFFNPGLLWISSLVRIERENCCDDIAISHTGNKTQFIEALISFKEHSTQSSEYMIAFPGKKNLLVQRASRIIQNKNKGLNLREALFFIGSLLFCSLLLSTIAKPGERNKDKEILSAPENYTFTFRIKEQGKPAEDKQFDIKLPAKPARKSRDDKRQQQILQQDMDEAMKIEKEDINTQPETEEQNSDVEEMIVQKEKAAADRHETHRELEDARMYKESADHARKQSDDDREAFEQERQRAAGEAVRAEKDRRLADKDRERVQKDRERVRSHLSIRSI